MSMVGIRSNGRFNITRLLYMPFSNYKNFLLFININLFVKDIIIKFCQYFKSLNLFDFSC